ncbi:DUF6285 domain-containing protein [Bradyrhizobium sp.]|uniref:DUF6285 domain-containing protein n=1 Tax=Bradyrhizobium sp. TaxID=376 RepID=UPI00239ED672|nr:DUF6285 domain-containing protein [Bradyrhizobium sp.]MDE1932661.1 hypothetical protein [Bradyrhizobium sp.]
MQDEPGPTELTKAVADFLREDIAPLVSGHNAFKLRVAINMLDLVTRQLTLEAASDAAEERRVQGLLAMQGSLFELNRALADKIANGELDLRTPGLAEHLWQTTMDKLAVDQPTYAAYRRELERSKLQR